MISLQRLEGFYWVARTGGYARAARAFPYPITQAGVHQQVRRLEADLGCALFARAGKDRMQPTSAGQVLFDFAAPFLEGLRGVEAAISARTFGGTLRVVAASLHFKQLIPRWARRLGRQRPDIALEIREARRPDPAALLSGECDLLLEHLPGVPRGVTAQQVSEIFSFLALPARQPRVKLRALSGKPFVVYNSDLSAREFQLEALRRAGVRPSKLLGADTADAILGFVAAGLGAALVPWPTRAGPRVPGVFATRLAQPEATFPVHAAFRSSAVIDPLVAAALDAFRGESSP
ncbi:MAG TPA: LysR family transcriptional regulator [Myxococcales bacterium]|nr:LysR family transcriptional regulator [Myxococcales bacterium]